MSSVAITGASSLATASQSLLALTAAPFVFLTLPAAILGKEILSEITLLMNEADAARALQEANAGCHHQSALLLHQEVEREWQKERSRIVALPPSVAKNSLEEKFEQSYLQYQEDSARGEWSQLDSLIRNLRTLITETEIEEISCARLEQEFAKLCEGLSTAYPQQIATVVEDNQRISSEAPADRFAFLAKSIASIKPLACPNKKPIRLDQPCVAEIISFAEKIRLLDDDAFERVSPFLDEIESGTPFQNRMEMILTEFKILYASLKEEMATAQTLRDELTPLLSFLEKDESGRALVAEINDQIRQKFVARKDFLSLYERARVHIWETIEREREQELTARVTTLLEELGYQLESDASISKRSRGDIYYFNSPYKGYHVMVKISEGERIATRLVRFVETESEINTASPYQKQCDLEVAKSWCDDLDSFLHELASQGFNIQEMLRQEPEEADLLVLCDAKRSFSKNAKQKINTPKQRSLRNND